MCCRREIQELGGGWGGAVLVVVSPFMNSGPGATPKLVSLRPSNWQNKKLLNKAPETHGCTSDPTSQVET